MRFPDSFLDEIRARLPASEVVGRRVKLRKQGREYAGLSPFNAEKTPSFFVNDGKGKWFDFSAGKNGDIFTFLMETEGIGFPEAVERLAGEAGVPMPARDPQAEEREKQRASLLEVVEMAAAFFEAELQAPAGARARGYLQGRGIGPDLQKRFRIGYAPNARNALKEHLAGKGVDQARMIEAGLLIAGDDVPVSFDRFRDRVMFPIGDLRDRPVGFGGRALSADVPAKYLNSPETPLFHKGALLYNAAAARRAAHDAGMVVVVEGYTDVIGMAGAGLDNAVAPLGTALTDRQLGLLWRMADEPVLCFDGDDAGRRAAFRAIDLALPMLAPGKSLRFALLPTGQDPDDLIRDGGRAAMEQALAAAQPMISLLWNRETGEGVFDTPERRAALEARIAGVTRTIGDESVRRHYHQALAERVTAFFGYDRATPTGDRRPGRPGDRTGRGRRAPERRRGVHEPLPVSDRLRRSPLMAAGAAATPLREVVLMMTMVNHPRLLAEHLDAFGDIEFGHRDMEAMRQAVLDALVSDHDSEAPAVRARLEAGPMAPLLARLDRQLRALGHWPASPDADDRDAAEGWRQALALHRRNRTLHRELRDAETALARDPSDVNLARLVDIQKQLASHEGTEALIEGFGAGSGRSPAAF